MNTIMKKLKISNIELASETNLPKIKDGIMKMEKGFMVEYKKDVFGNVIIDNQLLARTMHNGEISKIWVSPGLKGVHINGHRMAKSILNHEFIHARHVMLGLNNTRYLERSAWSYNYAYARYHNLPVNGILKHLNSYGGFHIPKNYMWSNLGLDKFLKLF